MRHFLIALVLLAFVLGLSAQTVDTPLSESGVVKLQLATTTYERDLLKAQVDADTYLKQAQAKAQKVYQDALTALAAAEVHAGCTLASGAEGKPPVVRCPVGLTDK